MDSDNLVSINTNANQKFLDGKLTKVAEKKQSQNGKDTEIINTVMNGVYDFSWGTVSEQIAGNFYIWGFSFSSLTNKSHGEIQESYQKIFQYLQDKHPKHSSEHPVLVAGLHDWCIYPGHGKDAIIVATPFQKEYTSRIWVHGHLLSDDIPHILSTLNT